jgi:hypothetical protein
MFGEIEEFSVADIPIIPYHKINQHPQKQQCHCEDEAPQQKSGNLLIVAVTIIFWHYLVAEFGGYYIYKRRKSFKVTIGKFLVISFAGVCLGYIMVYFNGQCLGIAQYYPDISSFYSSHSSPTLVRLAVFYKIVLIPWAVSTFSM